VETKNGTGPVRDSGKVADKRSSTSISELGFPLDKRWIVAEVNEMATPPAAAIKARIMQYMNIDRPETLGEYLKFYNNVNAVPQSAKLVDFDLDFLKIEYTTTAGSKDSCIVKIIPPMSNLSESRVKFVAMAEEATGKSYHQLPDATAAPPLVTFTTTTRTTKGHVGWTLPEWPGLISLSGICFGYWALSYPFPLSPEGPLIRILPTFLVLFGRNFREQLFAMMIGIHVIEGMVVAGKCLEQGMSIPLLVLWTINGFFEGGPTIMRINKLIAQNGK
jgi:hypothetical protein